MSEAHDTSADLSRELWTAQGSVQSPVSKAEELDTQLWFMWDSHPPKQDLNELIKYLEWKFKGKVWEGITWEESPLFCYPEKLRVSFLSLHNFILKLTSLLDYEKICYHLGDYFLINFPLSYLIPVTSFYIQAMCTC